MSAQWDVPESDRARFERDTSLDDLAELIRLGSIELRRVARVVEWLEELRDRRIDEVGAGTWPYPADPDAVSFPCGCSHVCLSCSPRPDVPGPGCINCRQTGYDQTPCVPCAEEVRVGVPTKESSR